MFRFFFPMATGKMCKPPYCESVIQFSVPSKDCEADWRQISVYFMCGKSPVCTQLQICVGKYFPSMKKKVNLTASEEIMNKI